MYLNQRALWLPQVSSPLNNPYGDVDHKKSEISIPVRRQEHVEEIRTKDGAIHHTNFIYYTHADVKIDDRIDGNLVVDSYDMRTLGGYKRLRRLKTI